MLKIKFFVAVFCATLLCMGSIANASILSGYLTYDGVEDGLTDDSRASKTNPTQPLAVNDIIYGVIQITSVQSSGVPNQFLPPQTIAAIFSATITGGSGTGASPFTLGATAQTGAGGLGLDALAPNLWAASGATAAEKANSIFLVGSNSNNLNLLTEVGGTAKNSLIAADSTLMGAGGMYEATGGIQVGLNEYGDADFFEAVVAFGVILERGGFTIFDMAFPGPITSVPSQHLDSSVTDHDLSLSGLVRPFNPGSVYLFDDDARLGLNVVPEPMSLFVWAGIASLGCCVAVRRRRSEMVLDNSK